MKAFLAALSCMIAIQPFHRAATTDDTAPLVGAPAPPLHVAKWLKGRPITSFVPGRVYVIDVWAPWCGPCLGGMKHLTELQHRESRRQLTVIGVTGPDPYGTTLAAAKEVLVDKKNDIDYAIAWDEGRKFYESWMAREQSSGWPWCFVVDRTGRIAYIGHPEKLDASLDAILAGTFDLQAAATRYKRRASALRVASIFETFYAREEWPKGDALYQELLQADEQVAAGYAAHEYKILAYRMKDPGRAAAFGRRAAATFLKADRGMLVRLAEMVLDPKLDLQPRDLDLARLCAERADALAGESNASTAATLARVCSAQGEWTRTIDAQRRAVRLADPHDRAELQKTLDEYLAAAGKAR